MFCRVVKCLVPPHGNFQRPGTPKKMDAKAAVDAPAFAAVEAETEVKDRWSSLWAIGMCPL